MYPAPQTRPMLAGALAAAARGWHVFPLLPNTKRPARPDHRAVDCTGTDPRCRDGHTGWDARATTDTDRIRRAWADDAPTYGLGIACGPSGLVVVDLDTAKPGTAIPEPWNRFGITTGVEVLDHIAGARGGTITPTFTVRTPSGGTHLYYRAPEGVRFGNTAGTIGWLIDTRAHGGYVVAPPTIIATSTGVNCYAVVEDRPPAPLPLFLLDLLSPQRHAAPNVAPKRLDARAERLPAYVAAAVKGERTKIADAMPGQRNHVLFCAAVALGQLVAGGALDEEDAFHALAEAAWGHVEAGAFSPTEAEATIRSGFATGARNPRTPRDNSRRAA